MAARRTAPALAADTSSVTETETPEGDATDVPVAEQTEGVSAADRAIEVAAEASRREKLRGIPAKWANPPESWLTKLPKPTGKNNPKGRCKPRSQGGEAPDWQDHYCGGYHGLPAIHLDVMGHADLTLALIDVDPEWEWGLGWESTTGPIDAFAFSNPSDPTIMLGWLKVNGVKREGMGTVSSGKGGDGMKELYGDLLRNCGMRFGIGTGLWSKAQRDGHDPDATGDSPSVAAPAATPPPAQLWSYRTLKAKALELVTAAGIEPAKEVAREMWELVVPVTVPEDHEFNPDEVNRYCADFAEWLAGDTPEPGEPAPDAGEQLIDSGEALR